MFQQFIVMFQHMAQGRFNRTAEAIGSDGKGCVQSPGVHPDVWALDLVCTHRIPLVRALSSLWLRFHLFLPLLVGLTIPRSLAKQRTSDRSDTGIPGARALLQSCFAGGFCSFFFTMGSTTLDAHRLPWL